MRKDAMAQAVAAPGVGREGGRSARSTGSSSRSLVAAKLAVHLASAGRYGYFRDELYFLDCGRHLDWGYVDCAPLIAVYAKIALAPGGSLPSCGRSRRWPGRRRVV